MFYIELKGGLGNQLFQLFHLLSLSLETRQAFVIQHDVANNHSVNPYWDTLFTRLRPFVRKDCSFPIHHVVENTKPFYYSLEFDQSIIHKSKTNVNIHILGYYQSYLYFEKHIHSILNILHWKEQLEHVKTKEIVNIGKKSISMHFRVGDYKKYPDLYPILSIDYYIHALRDFLSFEKGAQVFIFFDPKDKDIVLQNIQCIQHVFQNGEFSFELVENGSDWQQLLLMTMCNHHIIANSTFSWWGAYLSFKNNQRIYYPKNWIKTDDDLSNLFPPHWIQIS